MKTPSERLKLLGPIVGFILMASFFARQICRPNPRDDRAFDSTIWRAQSYSEERYNPRMQMIDDLCTHYLRTGMTKREVIDLLGEPDAQPMPEHASFDIVYRLGRWDDWFLMNQLTISFDVWNKVYHFSIRGHQ